MHNSRGQASCLVKVNCQSVTDEKDVSSFQPRVKSGQRPDPQDPASSSHFFLCVSHFRLGIIVCLNIELISFRSWLSGAHSVTWLHFYIQICAHWMLDDSRRPQKNRSLVHFSIVTIISVEKLEPIRNTWLMWTFDNTKSLIQLLRHVNWKQSDQFLSGNSRMNHNVYIKDEINHTHESRIPKQIAAG